MNLPDYFKVPLEYAYNQYRSPFSSGIVRQNTPKYILLISVPSFIRSLEISFRSSLSLSRLNIHRNSNGRDLKPSRRQENSNINTKKQQTLNRGAFRSFISQVSPFSHVKGLSYEKRVLPELIILCILC